MKSDHRYLEIFSPGAPVLEKKYFIGRKYETETLGNAIVSRGMSAIIYGPRGIGKTTLALQSAEQFDSKSVQESCSPKTKYEYLAKRIFRKVRRLAHSNEISMDVQTSASSVNGNGSKDNIGFEPEDSVDFTDPVSLAEILCNVDFPITIIIDELENKKFDTSFMEDIANLVKKTSDFAKINVITFFLIGVAKNAHDLFHKHTSIQRCLTEVPVKNLTGNAVKEFLDIASNELGFEFERGLLGSFVRDTLGVPFYLHAVGQNCLKLMRKDKVNVLSEDIYDFAVDKAYQENYRSEKAKFKDKSFDLTDNEKQVLIFLGNRRDRETFIKSDKVFKHLPSGSMTWKEFELTIEKLSERELILDWKNMNSISLESPFLKGLLRRLSKQGLLKVSYQQRLL